ncbi:SMC-Scp complex subunit ScpB [Plantibacter sp. YIM 135249]|uniref:SMC-Scp complex subunit ScpB n=1 Tax=Plantibacter sp. YIM 135249 TaxID=3423918 RepID=UPI003D34022A
MADITTDQATTDQATTDDGVPAESVIDQTASDETASDENLIAQPAEPEPGPEYDTARALEALLMVADEPQSLVNLATALHQPVRAIRAAIAELVADYDGVDGTVRRGFELREVGGGWRFYVRAQYDPLITDYVITQNPTKLSQAALETLAVIAYKQPISRGAIASIRAVNVDSVVRTLLGRGLVTEMFTDSETGAINYGTTDLLLTQLGINAIDELPQISPLLDDGQEGFDSDLH